MATPLRRCALCEKHMGSLLGHHCDDCKSILRESVGEPIEEDDDESDIDVPLVALVSKESQTSPVCTESETARIPQSPAEVIEILEDDLLSEEEEDEVDINEEDEPLVTFEADSDSCPFCDANLQKLQASSRVQHLKRCHKRYGGESGRDERMDTVAAPNQLCEKNPYFRAPPAPKSALDVLMAGAKRASKLEKLGISANPKGGKRPRSEKTRGQCPAFKNIPGTDFVVDGFQYSAPTQNYFLTHFHSDHYGGITKGWDRGIIYCSPITAQLLHRQLGVSPDFVCPLALDRPHSIGNATVQLIDANHCPGAILFLFTIRDRHILHVGDFRWNRSMLPPLQTWLQGNPLDELFLDTTYCDPRYKLPPQEETIQATVEAVVKLLSQVPPKHKVLLLFGAYSIGKERIYLAVAERLKCLVYVDARRKRLIDCLDFDPNRFTTDPRATNLWVVPLGHVSMVRLPKYLSIRSKKLSRDYDQVIGVRPTGWTYKEGSPIVSMSSTGGVTVCKVPYSEHSSFDELVDCVRCLRASKIVPTVSTQSSDAQVALLEKHAGIKV